MSYCRARRRESIIHKNSLPLPTPKDVENPANLLAPLIVKILTG
jgi:hypothetical protein